MPIFPKGFSTQALPLLACMPEGIGDLTFGSPEWVDAAREVLTALAPNYTASLADLDSFTVCEVAHNPPAYLRCGSRLAWYATFRGTGIEITTGELPAGECNYKVEGDHSIMSLGGRIRYSGSDPAVVELALSRLRAVGKWKIDGAITSNPGIGALLGIMHDELAPRTMPRFVFGTPEWASIARSILTIRAQSEECAAALRDLQFTLAQEFTHMPSYACPDGSVGGFWARIDHGRVTVGAGAVPEWLQPPDRITRSMYIPLVPASRTFTPGLSAQDVAELEAYNTRAWGDQGLGDTVFEQLGSEIPAAADPFFATLHDELVKRTSGELPSDFLSGLPEPWVAPLGVDRDPAWESSWVRYDEVDIYGSPLQS